MKITLENKKARYNYYINNTLECGISLSGNEIKSISNGLCNIANAWCSIENGTLIIHNLHISKWKTANSFDVEENRDRVLLAHKNEIRKLEYQIKENGLTIIPIKIYFTDTGKCKCEISVCKGKKLYDKREDIKKRDIERNIEKEL